MAEISFSVVSNSTISGESSERIPLAAAMVFSKLAAGLVILTEAGGKITTFDGGDYDLNAPNIAASNVVLHAKLLSCLDVRD